MFGDDGDDLLLVLNGEFYDNSYGGNGTDTLDHSASTYSGSTFDFEAGLITGAGINGASAVLSASRSTSMVRATTPSSPTATAAPITATAATTT